MFVVSDAVELVVVISDAKMHEQCPQSDSCGWRSQDED